MTISSEDLLVAKVGAEVYAIATAAAKVALERLGVLTDTRASLDWTHGSNLVTGAATDSANVGRWIFNVDTFEFYRIDVGFTGVSYTLDRNYVGAAGTNGYDSIVFTPATAVVGRAGFVWGGEK